MFSGWIESGGVARAMDRGLVSVAFTNLRDFGLGRHVQVDDYPFGGGAGMVLMAEPIFKAVESIPGVEEGPIVLMSPRGRPFHHSIAVELSSSSRLTLISGHYEGVDERVSEHLVTDELSIGDYVLSGGELPAMVVLDAVTRLLPGVLDSDSTAEESFLSGVLEYPQYTRPASFRGWKVPEVLTSGNHAEIARWRRDQAEKRTQETRPDLIGPTSDRPKRREA